MTMVKGLRSSIFTSTGGCCCSVGVGQTKVVARVALSKAKPDAEYYGDDSLIQSTLISDLPGVGRATVEKIQMALASLQQLTCADIRKNSSIHQIQGMLGERQGLNIWNACHGYDPVPDKKKHKKTCSVTVNYGVRLFSTEDLNTFVESIASELSDRVKKSLVSGKVKLVVTLRYRSPDAPVLTKKFLGMGKVDEVTGSVKLDHGEQLQEYRKAANHISLCISEDARLKVVSVQDLRGISVAVNEIPHKKIDASSSVVPPKEIEAKSVGSYFSDDEDVSCQFGDYTAESPYMPVQFPSPLRLRELIHASWRPFDPSAMIGLVDFLIGEKRYDLLDIALKLCSELVVRQGGDGSSDEQKKVIGVVIDYGRLRFKQG